MVWRAAQFVAVFWGACGRPSLIARIEPVAVAGLLLSANSGLSNLAKILKFLGTIQTIEIKDDKCTLSDLKKFI
ncbi:hypothetical protein GCM10011382_11110 [Vreelandella lutescens]|uniref:LAGLIDADG endonuclease n=1 Tax=Vreelandella lutescens TaxID=1602943 RepID=A0ABQ1NQ80_9GAMM|nr:hypothetical protein GCM10011382_11110 [Halomonas lutescens]